MLLSVGSSAKGIHARPVFADAVHAPAIQLDHAFIAAADVEDVGEPAVLLLVGDGHVAVNGFAGAGWSEDQHDAHAVHVHVLKEWRPCARLEDVQILVVQVFRIRMAEIAERKTEDKPRMVIFRQPHRKDVELVDCRETWHRTPKDCPASLP